MGGGEVNPQNTPTPRTHPAPKVIPPSPPPEVTHPPPEVNPKENRESGNTVNKRAVRILLECILVSISFQEKEQADKHFPIIMYTSKTLSQFRL